MKTQRSLWRWAFVLWLLALGTISLWRGWTLWGQRSLLAELGSSLSPPMLALFVALFALCGVGLAICAAGLWQGRPWARQAARAFIPAYLAIVQAYTWLFVRSGLMWERRRVSLVLAVGAVALSSVALTRHRSLKWLGIEG